MIAKQFRDAVEAADLDAVVACLADDVVFHSPVTFKPFEGKGAVAFLFSVLLKTFEEFRYVDEYASSSGATILRFRTRVGDRDVEGIDLLHANAEGLIDDFTVMVRPLSAALALRDAVGAGLAAGEPR
jgi:hypothetical protein